MHDWKISEILNDEKPSKHFLDIARKGKSGSDINDIRDDVGNAFESKEELNEHIRCFYKKLYEKKNTVGTIEDFLGPEICNSELIKNSKLTEDEKDNLDKDLTLNELDESLRKSNFKSAPGRDGFSNCFIQGCGSGLIFYGSGSGSGSSIFSQSGSGSGSGSGSKLKQNFRRQFFSQIFLKSKFESNKIKILLLFIQIFFKK
jgi:hypothetical protein